MAYEVNFSLLQPVDIGGAIQTGYQHGRALRLQGEQDRAFELLARDPNSAEGRALLTASGHPDQARMFRQWGIEDRNEAFRRRALGLPDDSSQPSAFPAQNTPATPAGSPPANGTAVPAVTQPPASGAAPAASTGQLNLDPNIMRQWFAADPAGAREFLTSWNSLNDAQRAIATQRFEAAIPVLTQALSVPYEQRRAFIQSHAAELQQNGWGAEEIAGFDPTDANTQLMIRRGLPITQQRDYFAPSEAAPGTVGRDRFTGHVIFANPTQPRTEVSYDANGNQLLTTVPGTPAIGPDANLFGAGAQGGNASPAPPQVGEIRRGYRFRGGDPASPDSWERVRGTRTSSEVAPDWPVPGGAASVPRNFP